MFFDARSGLTLDTGGMVRNSVCDNVCSDKICSDKVCSDKVCSDKICSDSVSNSMEKISDGEAAMLAAALMDMAALEAGSVANPDEGRMVGHYWLRAPELAPDAAIEAEIRKTVQDIRDFAAAVHGGRITGADGRAFRNVLVIGIGGSSLGPVFVSHALKSAGDKMRLYFIDNTDPDGMDSVLHELAAELAQTLVVVISKSGGTVETQNGLVETREFFAAHGVDFYANAVRITQRGSAFDTAEDAGRWLAAFPMWDWVGGRTSVLSAVGLLPLSLQGVDCDSLLSGAAYCDELTRREYRENPALQLAFAWYRASGGVGGTTLAVLPYKDRLELFSKYLQQLIMESLGKEFDLSGRKVNQGLAVLGNKGSSDQHSYVQQLVAGPDDTLVIFIEVLRDRCGASPVVRDNSTAGDYLQAFLWGTAGALADHGKNSLCITVPEVSAYYIGMLIAFFERAVGFYASFIGINAYHQPAVEFGKKAAGNLIAWKNQVCRIMRENPGRWYTAAELNVLAAESGGKDGKISKDSKISDNVLWHILRHLAANESDIVEEEIVWRNEEPEKMRFGVKVL